MDGVFVLLTVGTQFRGGQVDTWALAGLTEYLVVCGQLLGEWIADLYCPAVLDEHIRRADGFVLDKVFLEVGERQYRRSQN